MVNPYAPPQSAPPYVVREYDFTEDGRIGTIVGLIIFNMPTIAFWIRLWMETFIPKFLPVRREPFEKLTLDLWKGQLSIYAATVGIVLVAFILFMIIITIVEGVPGLKRAWANIKS